MFAPNPKKVSFKTLRVINAFEVREVFFTSGKKIDVGVCCKTVDTDAHLLFSCVLYQGKRMTIIKERKSDNRIRIGKLVS